MKLYATITSERASKGQGGKSLYICVKNEQKEEIAEFWIDGKLIISKIREDMEIDARIGLKPATKAIKQRLEYLRKELRAERISYGELAELQGLAQYIDKGDVELLEAAGVPEFPDEEKGKQQKGERIGGDDRQFKDWPSNGA